MHEEREGRQYCRRKKLSQLCEWEGPQIINFFYGQVDFPTISIELPKDQVDLCCLSLNYQRVKLIF